MFNFDYGESLYKSWSDQQRREEIGRLVEGYRNGVPIGIVCGLCEKIAGSPAAAREILVGLLSAEERRVAVDGCEGGLRTAVAALLL